MDNQNLLIEEENGIILITINRPKALNALNHQTMAELERFFGGDGLKREHIKGVILRGAGDRAFVAGADIKEFLSIKSEEGKEMAQRGHDIFFMIERFPRPVIALINGFALGGGCELAMACHIRIATENAKFGQPEVNLGIIPGYGGTQRLLQNIGKSKAIELMLTGDMIDADEAFRMGLLSYVLPQDEALDKAKSILNKVGTKGPIAIAKVIECVNAYYQDGVDGFVTEVNAFGVVTQTDDFKEGAQAFLEKRKPNFVGG